MKRIPAQLWLDFAKGGLIGWLVAMVILLTLFVTGRLHGQVYNDPAAADANRAWMQKCADAKEPIRLAGKTLYTRGLVALPPTVGCGRLITTGASGDSVGEHPTLNGMRAKIVQLGKGPIFRLAGAGFVGSDPVELVGDNASAAVEIEGRLAPATGRHLFAGWVFRDWAVGVKTLAGYYQDGKFMPCEAHADNSQLIRCETFNCGCLFESNNQQSLNWVLQDCKVNGLGMPNYQRCIIARINRGGCTSVIRPVIEELHCTVFEGRDYSPNNCRLVVRDWFYDRMLAAKHDFRVFDYTGRPEDANFCDWSLVADGGWSGMPIADVAELFAVPTDLPRWRWKINFDYAGAQPPKPPKKPK